MITFVLLPGPASTSWYWHRVAPILEAAGHEVVAVDLPLDDDGAGLDAYREAVTAAIGNRQRTGVVAQSMGAFTARMIWRSSRSTTSRLGPTGRFMIRGCSIGGPIEVDGGHLPALSKPAELARIILDVSGG